MRILITAGPTREPIDPVRYLSNHSSGKMGYALAAAAVERGHEVTLVSGPVHIAPPRPEVAQFIRVETALEMQAAVHAGVLDGVDAVIMCAAVADFRPAALAGDKLKKEGLLAAGREGVWNLELVPNPDILAGLRDLAPQAILVGFAAETSNALEHARAKLASKRCDLLVLNNVAQPGIGFGAEDNEVLLLGANGSQEEISRRPKLEIARAIVVRVERLGGRVP